MSSELACVLSQFILELQLNEWAALTRMQKHGTDIQNSSRFG